MTMEDLQERIEQLQGATQSAGEPEMVPEKEQPLSAEKKRGEHGDQGRGL